jgi:hypothetical protein
MRTLGDAIDTSVWNVGYGQAGKNKIINGDFAINQRAFTSTTTTNTFGFDRWLLTASDGTRTYSAQTFTTGAAPVADYESTNFARLVSTGQTITTAFTALNQKIEDVRTFAGQTVTVSFFAKASTGTPSVAASLWQEFGSGGSATTQQGSKIAITSSWARYSVTISVPSVSGKTIGSSSDLRLFLITSAGSTRDAYTGSLGIQSVTIDFWGVQLEYGSKATPFQTATGTIQGERAACMRYYQRINAVTAYGGFGAIARVTNTGSNGVSAWVTTSIPLRVPATSLDVGGDWQVYGTIAAGITGLTLQSENPNTLAFFGTSSGAVASRIETIIASNNAASFIGWSAEL